MTGRASAGVLSVLADGRHPWDGSQSEHIGQVYAFRITEFKEGGRNLVVSRRVLLEEAQEGRRGGTPEVDCRRLPVMKGRVVSVREFGAFVELGSGACRDFLHVFGDGLQTRVADPTTLLSPGQEIEVKVLRVEADGEKIALGLRQLTADPWTTVAEHYAVGQVVEGQTVTVIAEFGAFVELEPGVEGLAHASTFPLPTGGARGWTRATPGRFDGAGRDPGHRSGQEADRGRHRQKGSASRAACEATDAHQYFPTQAPSSSTESFGIAAPTSCASAIGTRK